MIKPQSAKQKGRKLQQTICKRLLDKFPGLTSRDVKSTSMGSGGCDVQLSSAAAELFPFSIECKNQENLNVWQSFKQAEANLEEGMSPMLIFKRNKSDTYVMLKFDDFLEFF